MTEFPEWARVKCAAIFAVVLPTFNNLLVNLTPWLDILIKVGQVGVATATIFYIFSKWRAVRKTQKDE